MFIWVAHFLWDPGIIVSAWNQGGIVFGCLENAKYDPFDLGIPSAMGTHDMVEKYFSGEIDKLDKIMNLNPVIKAVVVNQAWPGLPISDVPLT